MKRGDIVRVDLGVNELMKKRVVEFGTGAHITLPLQWLGRNVVVILSEDVNKAEPKSI